MILNHLWGQRSQPQPDHSELDPEQQPELDPEQQPERHLEQHPERHLEQQPEQQPKQDARHQGSAIYSISHILIISLIPAICSYFSAVYLGWYINFEATITLTPIVAVLTAIAMYCMIVSGVFALALVACKIAHRFNAHPSLSQTIELASYATTPLLICGFTALFPQLWFIATISSCGILYSIYLLFTGVPMLIDIDEDKRLRYSYALVFCGSILLLGIMSTMGYLWWSGIIPRG